MAKIKRQASDSHKTRPKGVNKDAFERVYWPYIPIVLAICLLLVVGSAGGGLKAAAKRPFGRVLSYAATMSVNGLLADTNSQRSANGVASLSLNSQLEAAAQASANDMAARNYWSHYTPEGNPPWVWVTNQGYSYQKVGQNLAAGFSDEQATINGWMASPPHRENMLDPSYTDVGFGYANNPDYTSAGGGPMTIVVAFYGQPQVLGASTVSPPAAPAHTASPPPAASVAPPAAASTTPDNSSPAASTKPQPATSDTPKASLPVSTTTSHLQLAAPSSGLSLFAAKLGIILAFGIALFWANRHIRALHRWLLRGERYAIRHPLTDAGLLIIAALLFIVSQTAGLIQ